MKIITILGTRPEIIRLSLILKKLDLYADKHIVIHTGQNFTPSLSDVFFDELKLRKPDYQLNGNKQSLGEQLGVMYVEIEKILKQEKPDKVLILGDTNSGLNSILAERMNIPVVHMEAGNRCYDWNVPEEMNRQVIDTVSSFNLPYTPGSRENLLREGIPSHRIFVSGNPIFEVIEHFKKEIDSSSILSKLNLIENDYFLVTIHRAENVDDGANLSEILLGLNLVAKTYKKRMIFSTHPRTKSKIESSSYIHLDPLIEFHEPFGFFDFVQLEKNAFCTLTDSGTVQEECCLFHVPTVTVRKTTERPETIECGSNMLSGLHAQKILNAVKLMTESTCQWSYPEGYIDPNVSEKVVKFLLGNPVIKR